MRERSGEVMRVTVFGEHAIARSGRGESTVSTGVQGKEDYEEEGEVEY